MGADILLVDRADGVATATITRPPRRNALNADLFGALRRLFEDVAHDPADRVLVLRGAERTFSSGGDLAGGGQRAEGAPAEGASPRRAVESMRHDVGRCAL